MMVEDLWIDLPEELLCHVLAFLPMSSLFRFRCVCKKWNSVVKDLRFQKTRASIRGGEHFLFHHEFIQHTFKCLANTNSQLVTIVGGFLLLFSRCRSLHVVDPANVCLKKIPCLEPESSSTAQVSQYPVGMVVNSGTRDYSIFVASKDILRQSFCRGPICVHQYNSTEDAWRLAWRLPLAPMEVHCELMNVAMHRGSFYFLIMGRSETRLGGNVSFRVMYYEKQYRRWESLTGGFPNLVFTFKSIPLLFEHSAKLFLSALFLGRYSVWQYNDGMGKWDLLFRFPEEFTGSGETIRKASFCAQCCGDFLHVGKWSVANVQLPSVMIYNLVNRQYKGMPSDEVERELIQVWPGRLGRHFLFQPVY